MKRLVVLAVLLSACKINDATFTPLGGGDDTDDAGNGDAPIMLIDAPPGLPAMQRGFLAAGGTGLFVIRKSGTGDLSLAMATPIQFGNSSAIDVVTNKMGTHVYVALVNPSGGGGEIRDLSFNGTSMLSGASNPVNCTPYHIAVNPAGKHLIVGCTTPQTFVLSLDPNGAIVTGSMTMLPQSGGQSSHSPAFSPDGSCLFVADRAGGTQAVASFRYNAITLGYEIGITAGGPGPVNEISVHPGGAFLYLTSDRSVQAYRIAADCTLTTIGFPPSLNMQAARGAVVDPQGGRYFAVGDRISPFDIAADGSLTAISGGGGITGNHVAATFDPALPSTMYTTSTSYGGVFRVEIATSGAMTMGTGYGGGLANAAAFVLAP